MCGSLWLPGHESIICLQAAEVNKNTSISKIAMEIYQVTKAALRKEHIQIKNKYFLILKFKFLFKETHFEASDQSGCTMICNYGFWKSGGRKVFPE